MAARLYSVNAPRPSMAGARIQCEITGKLLTVNDGGVISGLTEPQVSELLRCGYTLAEGAELFAIRTAAKAAGAAIEAASVARAALLKAVRAGIDAKCDRVLIDEVIAAEGNGSLPKVAELIDKKASKAEPPPMPPKAEKAEKADPPKPEA